MDNYATIVNRSDFRYRIVNVGKKPYWSTNNGDGTICFVSVSGDDRVSAISYATRREVARIPVDDHPQRMRMGTIRSSYVGPRGTGPACTIRGTADNDVLRGTARDDVICGGGGGGDVLAGLAGDDHLSGGPGDDDHRGGEGRDFINARDGERGNDIANGGPDEDFCEINRGDARISC
jgi:Ca2+-binding RTX toxin-like protein